MISQIFYDYFIAAKKSWTTLTIAGMIFFCQAVVQNGSSGSENKSGENPAYTQSESNSESKTESKIESLTATGAVILLCLFQSIHSRKTTEKLTLKINDLEHEVVELRKDLSRETDKVGAETVVLGKREETPIKGTIL